MSCFWDGEATLGNVEGIVEIKASWLDGHDVVRLSYDSKTIIWPDLVNIAQKHCSARSVYAPNTATLAETPNSPIPHLYIGENYRAACQSNQKRHLQFSKFKQLTLNPVQRTKMNTALSRGNTFMLQKWLSPSQI